MNIIIGAGMAGLSAAYHLGSDDYLVLEREAEVGGACRSIYVNGFTFDHTGHVMHFRHDYVRNLAKKLLGGNLLRHLRRSSIYFEGQFIPYPFQMNLFKLPPEVKKECIMGAIRAKYEGGVTKPQNFAEWILSSLGEGIAKHFMFPYNEKLWTVHPREMSTAWLHGFVPQPDLEAIIDGAIRERTDHAEGYNAEFWYPLHGGIMQYAMAFVPYIRNLQLNVGVERVDLKTHTIWAGGKKYPYSNLISAVPLVALVEMIEDAPAEINCAASKLRWNSVYSVLLGIDRADVSDQHWIYFPQKDLIFYRVVLPSNLSPNMSPAGTSSICAEVAYRGSLEMSKEELIDRTIQDLKKAGLLRADDRILVREAINKPYAYVIYDHSYEANRKLIQDYLQAHRIFSIGRYGAWEYSSIEEAILESKDIAEWLNGRGQEIVEDKRSSISAH